MLGIDPGSVCTGYGVIEKNGSKLSLIDYGAIQNKTSDLLSERFLNIYQNLKQVLSLTRPECVAIEEVFFCKNVNSAIKLGEARGVAILAAREAHCPIIEYSAKRVKRAVVGYGSAAKSQVGLMVKRLLGLSEIPTPIDAADALAVAICHAHSMKSFFEAPKYV